jgi:hypothetical protein
VIYADFLPVLLQVIQSITSPCLKLALGVLRKICECGVSSTVPAIVERFPVAFARRTSTFLSPENCFETCHIIKFFFTLDDIDIECFVSRIFTADFFEIVRTGSFHEKLQAVELLCYAQKRAPTSFRRFFSCKTEIVMEMIDLSEVVTEESAIKTLKEGLFDMYATSDEQPEIRDLIEPLFEAGILQDVCPDFGVFSHDQHVIGPR